MATIDDFAALDIRVGTVVRAETNTGARKAAYKLWVDFEKELGVKTSSAQITELYSPDSLVGRQVLAVVNFPPRKVAGFESQVLVLGTYSTGGVVLIVPERPVSNGDKLG
jgi:tRNA-binding protein